MSQSKVQINQEIENIKQKVSDALALAKSFGVSEAEVAISRQRGLSISSRNREVETVEFNQDGALGISVYRNGRKGSASTADLSDDALKRTVKAACDIANHTSEDKCAGLADKDLLEFNPKDLDLYHAHQLNSDDGIKMAIEAEEAAFAVSDKITNSDGANVSAHEGFRVYGNTHEQLVGYPTTRYSISCGMIAQGDELMQRDAQYTLNRNFNLLRSAADIGRESAQSAVAKLNARKLDTMEVPVVFRADIASSLFSHLVSAIGGGNVYRKTTFMLDKVGEQILSKNINITEKPHLLAGIASTPFDSEGVKTCEQEIITDGVLNSYLLATYAARRLDLKSTGHAGGIHNWMVQPTLGDFDDVIKTMDKGLIVTELMGQGVNIVNGDYSRGAGGFWVENGKIQYPVNEITIASNLADMYRNIVGCGSDVDMRSNVQTGSILIEKMRVAGN